MDEIRRKKLEDQLREEIAALILGGEVKDPRVGPFVSLTRVEAARDLSVARVYVSVFDLSTAASVATAAKTDAVAALSDQGPNCQPGQTGNQDSRIASAVEGLQRASGFIQARLAKRVRMRVTPKLLFVADRGIKEGFELNEKIKGLFL